MPCAAGLPRFTLNDPRVGSARFYDLSPNLPNDLSFYLHRLRGNTPQLLELGCGTGRLTLPLSAHCSLVVGVDRSFAMLQVLRKRLSSNPMPPRNLHVVCADVRRGGVNGRFDLVIAPYRLFQTLIDDDEIDAFFDGIRRNLSVTGRCIVTALRPQNEDGAFQAAWASGPEKLAWSVDTPEGLVQCFHSPRGADPGRLTASWALVYRRSVGGTVLEESTLPISFRFFRARELLQVIERAGFVVTNCWGGYSGEEYGRGPELIAEFSH